MILELASLWPFVLLAALPMAWIRPMGRIVFFVLGLLFFLAMSFTPLGGAGLHGEGMLIASWGLALCAAALLAEIAARLAGALRRTRQDSH